MPELPPTEVLFQIGYAAAVSAAALLLTWPWRERGWPVPVALGLGVLACHVASVGFPDRAWPPARADRLFHFAALGLVLGTVEAAVRVPAVVRWILRAAACAACAWALMPPVDPLWKVGAVGVGAFLAWSAFAWRAGHVEGYGGPAVLVVVTGAGAVALAAARTGRLGQLAGALSAAAGPVLAYALLRRKLPLAGGAVTVYMLASLPLWIAGWRLAKLPLGSAAVLAVAPIAAQQRRGWLGVLAAGAAAAFAAYLSWRANPSEFDPSLGY
ncbi:MAG TPA: hypothetical protein VFY93_19590 [Planctomycetota bacterium]|nr:hypothetical protein [Planctomycetota bacterium]